ncbi:hypothetical protein MQE36_16255 [Zhouia spongiae]|uniref:Methylamine utilisation protein MauE domain-containing protein n=1 Tax=Zhouia spongiae TaxID=2202721 RepID=A0ABY3YLY7_9FLAO|nr:MauE/DoxX family redox-associated membrane protein [Zhouia spongiae]UNY98619.1 hypothetical protein MQE36_16255 [Zhouia spongiae]
MKWYEKHRKIIIEIICLLFILLFVYAGVSKLTDFQKFRIQVGQSPLLTSVGRWIVWLVPVTELIIASMLCIPKFRLQALYVSFGLMVVFTTYIVMILKFSPFVPCSCGGILDKMGWTEHLIFNIGFVFLAMFGVLILGKVQFENSK